MTVSSLLPSHLQELAQKPRPPAGLPFFTTASRPAITTVTKRWIAGGVLPIGRAPAASTIHQESPVCLGDKIDYVCFHFPRTTMQCSKQRFLKC